MFKPLTNVIAMLFIFFYNCWVAFITTIIEGLNAKDDWFKKHLIMNMICFGSYFQSVTIIIIVLFNLTIMEAFNTEECCFKCLCSIFCCGYLDMYAHLHSLFLEFWMFRTVSFLLQYFLNSYCMNMEISLWNTWYIRMNIHRNLYTFSSYISKIWCLWLEEVKLRLKIIYWLQFHDQGRI